MGKIIHVDFKNKKTLDISDEDFQEYKVNTFKKIHSLCTGNTDLKEKKVYNLSNSIITFYTKSLDIHALVILLLESVKADLDSLKIGIDIAKTKQEVQKCIEEFRTLLKKDYVNFGNSVIEQFRYNSGYKKNYVNFNNIFDNNIFPINNLMVVVYKVTEKIAEANSKSSDFASFIKDNYEVGTSDYYEATNLYLKMVSANLLDFDDVYNKALEFVNRNEEKKEVK
ncbi:MAG: hypothetical protein ACI31S_02820 [Bacilli bacterium]